MIFTSTLNVHCALKITDEELKEKALEYKEL